MIIGIPIYEKVDLLDVTGAVEISGACSRTHRSSDRDRSDRRECRRGVHARRRQHHRAEGFDRRSRGGPPWVPGGDRRP